VTPGWRGEELEVAAVKLFADGALGSYTAWMYEPYPDGSHGFPLDDREVMVEEGKAALAAGYTLAIHAIGTRAVAEVLDAAYELAPLARRRLRIEHVQHVRTPEVQAIGELPLGLSLQPIHLRSDADLVRRRLPGQEREAFRLRDLWGTGVPLAFGSDAPVAPPDLAGGLLAATDHPLSPLQSVDEEQALHAFTRGAALVAGWNDYGVLAPGARADLGLWEDGRLVGRVFRGELDG
jgi:predicted amidohydrolase YtcJ